jgi:hypothetical protein
MIKNIMETQKFEFSNLESIIFDSIVYDGKSQDDNVFKVSNTSLFYFENISYVNINKLKFQNC